MTSLESSEKGNKKTLSKCSVCGQEGHTKRSKECPQNVGLGKEGSDTSLHKIPMLANLKTSKLHTKRPKESPNSSASEKQDSSGATLYQIPSSKTSTLSNKKIPPKHPTCGQVGQTRRPSDSPKNAGLEKKDSSDATLYQIPSSEMTQNKPENSKTGSKKMSPKCDQEGHTKQSKQCPQKKTHENKDRSDASPPAGRKNALPTCSSCGQVGHTKRSKDCPLNSTSEQESNVSIHPPIQQAIPKSGHVGLSTVEFSFPAEPKGNPMAGKSIHKHSRVSQEREHSSSTVARHNLTAATFVKRKKSHDHDESTPSSKKKKSSDDKLSQQPCRDQGNTTPSSGEKAAYKCSKCGQTGHNKQKCPSNEGLPQQCKQQ